MWEPSMNIPSEIKVITHRVENEYYLLTFQYVAQNRNDGILLRNNQQRQIGTQSANLSEIRDIAQLVFTGNRQTLEKEPDEIFLLIQEDCPMSFQTTNNDKSGKRCKYPDQRLLTSFTVGIYSFHVSDETGRKQPNWLQWSLAPRSVTRVAMLVERLVKCTGRDIREKSKWSATGIAWRGDSPMKVRIAQQMAV